ncbi:hypothetical protein MK974_24355 [Burkholderia ambifaria]|uniref:hypothetical protein n=1 Tax=Burkholderia ambifaria TaxID=152480 RepID=UPI0022A99DE4|nr:hypothetical protein [Burkholderia ambifaria]WAS56235.1 hypothetical protein MK974_24355 [Burkholderia ambifaria]
MKQWNIVFAILGGIAIVIMISAYGATSAGTEKYRPDYMASWVQATGGIVAIFASAVMVKWQFDKQRAQQEKDRREDSRKTAMYLFQIATEANVIADRLSTNLADANDSKNAFAYMQDMYDPNRLPTIGIALREIPLLELPSPEFVTHIIGIRTACERISEAALVLKEAKPLGLSAIPDLLQMPERAIIRNQAAYIQYSVLLVQSLMWKQELI